LNNYDANEQKMVIANKAAGAPTTSNYSKMFAWSGNLFSDTFS
jgi:hypothetical protein